MREPRSDDAPLHVEFSNKEEIQFLVSEIRSAQNQGSALLAATFGLLVFVKPLAPPRAWQGGIAVLSLLALLTLGAYFLNSLRIAGVYVNTHDGVFVRIAWLRMLTRRAYLTRTVCGIVLLVAVIAKLVSAITDAGLF